VGYLEAHGTGTSLGDPVEVSAVTGAYGKSCISSLKANVGHTEGSAGAAGVIALLSVLLFREVSANAHL